MKNKDSFFFWLLSLCLLGLFIYSVGNILLPFIVAIIAAYFLNPAAYKIQKLGASRNVATIFITVSFFLAAIAAIALLAPVLYSQLLTFMHVIPSYVTYINENVLPVFSRLLQKIDPDTLEKAKDSIGGASGYTIKFLAKIAANLLDSGMAALNLFSLVFITPVVTFYMLRDWDKILAKLNSYLPVQYADTIRAQAKEIDFILAGYIRGQTHVCLIIGTFYAVALTLANLEFSIFIGFATGILLFIPYVGMLFGFAVGMLVAFFQFGDLTHLGIIAGIFVIGQILESFFITPNLVGNKVHLHPVWIMFALLAGGAMFGFVGVLIAVPVAAVIGVLARFFIGEYLANKNRNIYNTKQNK